MLVVCTRYLLMYMHYSILRMNAASHCKSRGPALCSGCLRMLGSKAPACQIRYLLTSESAVILSLSHPHIPLPTHYARQCNA